MSSYDPARFPGRAPGAVDFLTTTAHALPRTLGDRDTIAAMSSAMELAIDSGMQFSLKDGERLRRLGISRQVGIFDPLWEGYYERACAMGGTYARLYEAVVLGRPWMAPKVFRCDWAVPRMVGRYARPDGLVENARVAKNFAVLLDREDEPENRLSRALDRQVWFCTSMDSARIVLCRYSQQQNPFERSGAPAKRWILSRDDWDREVRQEQAQQQPAAEVPRADHERAAA
ncbi:hypothetical protein [Ramlibacter sp. AN1133]|uniref:hypothetical protein n=1 Tax=Ramlibacter sp. AN1133 TaxID=3133429 RepID=UPI0030BB9322